MKRLSILILFAIGAFALQATAQQQQGEALDEINADDLRTSDFGWEDVEELPLPTEEEFGIQVDGKDYVPTPDPADVVEIEEDEAPEPQAAPARPAVPPQPIEDMVPELEIDDDVEIVEEEAVDAAPVDEGIAAQDLGGGEPEVVDGFGADQEIQPAAPTGEFARQTAPLPQRLGSTLGPEVYQIENGDTLWDISGRFFGNTFMWPKLWALNQYITNPHLIFPGDELRFFQGTATSAPRLEIAGQGEEVGDVEVAMAEGVDEPLAPEAPVETEEIAAAEVPTLEPAKDPVMTEEVSKPRVPGTIELKTRAFLTPKKLKTAGKIRSSGEEKFMLSTSDRIYLSFKDVSQVKVGDRYHIVEPIRKVKHPRKFLSTVGHLIQIKGRVRVTDITAKGVVSAVIEDSWQMSSRGDRVIPYESLLTRVVPKESSSDTAGTIVESATGNYMIGHRDLAFVDIGREEGLEAGDKLRVVRRGDGLFGNKKNLPEIQIAELTVIEPGDGVAMAFVNWTRKTLEVGDKVRTKPVR